MSADIVTDPASCILMRRSRRSTATWQRCSVRQRVGYSTRPLTSLRSSVIVCESGRLAGRSCGQRTHVLLRADFNVPLDTDANGHRFITDDGRIRAALPTIQSLTSQGAKVVILAHLGRPKARWTRPCHCDRLPRAFRNFLADVWSWQTMSAATLRSQWSHTSAMAKLHCWRTCALTPRDEQGRCGAHCIGICVGFPGRLLRLRWIRSGASGAGKRDGASQLLPHAAGLLVAREAEVFNTLITDPARPYTVVLGGSKVSDKLGVIANLIGKVDRLLIGGGMCFTFLVAQGYQVGSSLVEADQVEVVKGFLADARERGVDLVLPTDLVIADAFAADASTAVVSVEASQTAGWP